MNRIAELENKFKNLVAVYHNKNLWFLDITKKTKNNKRSKRILTVYAKDTVYNLEKITKQLIKNGGILN
jgi:hypothetical protein